VIAAVLGYSDIEEIKADQENAAFRLAAARGFDVDSDPDSVTAVCKVCDRAVRFLFKAITISRGEPDQPSTP